MGATRAGDRGADSCNRPTLDLIAPLLPGATTTLPGWPRGMHGAKTYLRCHRTPPECGKAVCGAERTPLGPAAATSRTERGSASQWAPRPVATRLRGACRRDERVSGALRRPQGRRSKRAHPRGSAPAPRRGRARPPADGRPVLKPARRRSSRLREQIVPVRSRPLRAPAPARQRGGFRRPGLRPRPPTARAEDPSRPPRGEAAG